jgi:hypothetical protein
MAIIVQDSFNRADNTTTLGSVETGQIWEIVTKSGGITQGGILQGQAYFPSTDNDTYHFSVVNIGRIDYQVQIQLIKSTLATNLAIRVQDSNNFFMLRYNNGKFEFYKRINGSFTLLGTYSTSEVGTSFSSITYTLKIRNYSNGLIEVFIDGTLQMSVTDTSLLSITKCGFGGYANTNQNSRYDNFIVESLDDSTNPVGTSGSVSYSTKNIIYRTSSNGYDSKQSMYRTANTLFDSKIIQYKAGQFDYDSKQSLFQLGSANYDTKNTIYNSSLYNFNTKLIIYNNTNANYQTKQTIYTQSSLTFDTLQQLLDSGIVGTLSFATKLMIYATGVNSFGQRQVIYNISSSPFSTKQSMYQNNNVSYSVRNQIYKQSAQSYDVKQIIYKIASIEHQLKLAIYQSGTVDFDTLQQMLDDYFVYQQVLKYVLEIKRKQSFDVGIVRNKKYNLHI